MVHYNSDQTAAIPACDEGVAGIEVTAEEVTAEIEAMRAIGAALRQLPDQAARARVLRWAAERFAVDASAAEPLMASAAPMMTTSEGADRLRSSANDPTLAVESLYDLFPQLERDQPQPTGDHVPHQESIVREFVTDFQRLARDWQTAFGTPTTSA